MSKIQLNVHEALAAQKFLAECDAKVEGFRLGMEVAKAMFVEQLVKQRKPEEPLPEAV